MACPGPLTVPLNRECPVWIRLCCLESVLWGAGQDWSNHPSQGQFLWKNQAASWILRAGPGINLHSGWKWSLLPPESNENRKGWNNYWFLKLVRETVSVFHNSLVILWHGYSVTPLHRMTAAISSRDWPVRAHRAVPTHHGRAWNSHGWLQQLKSAKTQTNEKTHVLVFAKSRHADSSCEHEGNSS